MTFQTEDDRKLLLEFLAWPAARVKYVPEPENARDAVDAFLRQREPK